MDYLSQYYTSKENYYATYVEMYVTTKFELYPVRIPFEFYLYFSCAQVVKYYLIKRETQSKRKYKEIKLVWKKNKEN